MQNIRLLKEFQKASILELKSEKTLVVLVLLSFMKLRTQVEAENYKRNETFNIEKQAS